MCAWLCFIGASELRNGEIHLIPSQLLQNVGMHLAKFNVDFFLTIKRNGKKNCRKKVARARRSALLRAEAHREKRRAVFGNQSVIAEKLSRGATKTLAMPQTSLYVGAPESFSVLRSPEKVLELVSAFALTHRKRVISDITVDFSRIKEQDLGAHALLDKLVDEIAVQAKFQGARLRWKGSYPRDPAQQRFVRAMGIIRQLGIRQHYLSSNAASKIVLFERRCRHYVRAVKPPSPFDKREQDNAAERFVNHINGCLAREGRELTFVSRGQLCNYVVEILDNVENHAGMTDWTIQGYLDMATENPECEIVILNFGKSIAETMSVVAAGTYIDGKIRSFLMKQELAGAYLNGFRREDLLTLFALQGSVSSKRVDHASTRGQGTADLIEFFQRMNDERMVEDRKSASMYILSGTTRILFDGRYRIHSGEGTSRTIAFNKENDLGRIPDSSCVLPLKSGAMPGTMIGIKFPIQAGSLQSTPQVAAM